MGDRLSLCVKELPRSTYVCFARVSRRTLGDFIVARFSFLLSLHLLHIGSHQQDDKCKGATEEHEVGESALTFELVFTLALVVRLELATVLSELATVLIIVFVVVRKTANRLVHQRGRRVRVMSQHRRLGTCRSFSLELVR